MNNIPEVGSIWKYTCKSRSEDESYGWVTFKVTSAPYSKSPTIACVKIDVIDSTHYSKTTDKWTLDALNLDHWQDPKKAPAMLSLELLDGSVMISAKPKSRLDLINYE